MNQKQDMNQKQNLFSIGEIAQAVGITRRMILNYEARGLISPDVKEGATGNRYYTIDTFTQVRSIRSLQNLGLSLDEIRGYFDDSLDLLSLIHRLERLRDELTLNIEKLYERTATAPSEIKKIRLNSQLIYRRSYRCGTSKERTLYLRNTALEAMRTHGTDITRRMYFTEYPISDPTDVSFCVSVPSESTGEYLTHLPSTDALCLFHHGSYENLPDVAQRLVEYAARNGFTARGTLRYVYLEGPPQRKDPNKFITQVVLPIADTTETP